MGLFSSFFGGGASKYSQEEKYLTAEEIKRLISHSRVVSIDHNNENAVEAAIKARRGSDGKISLRQIYEVLTQLKNQNKISEYDRTGVMKVMKDFFEGKL